MILGPWNISCSLGRIFCQNYFLIKGFFTKTAESVGHTAEISCARREVSGHENWPHSCTLRPLSWGWKAFVEEGFNSLSNPQQPWPLAAGQPLSASTGLGSASQDSGWESVFVWWDKGRVWTDGETFLKPYCFHLWCCFYISSQFLAMPSHRRFPLSFFFFQNHAKWK